MDRYRSSLSDTGNSLNALLRYAGSAEVRAVQHADVAAFSREAGVQAVRAHGVAPVGGCVDGEFQPHVLVYALGLACAQGVVFLPAAASVLA